MRSLRFRLVLGFSLVTIVPLALAMVLLSRRIQSTVQEQATDRLSASLAMLEADLRADAERMREKLELLARDPQLKRLYLVTPGANPDLTEYLGEKQFLLGLDFLLIADTSGTVVADASHAPSALSRREPGTIPVGTIVPARVAGLELAAPRGLRGLAMTAVAPVHYRNQVVGHLRGGVALDSAFLARLKRTSGLDLELHDRGGRLLAATLGPGPGPSPPGPQAGPGRGRGESYLSRSVALAIGPEPHPRLTGLVSTAAADQTIGALRTLSLVLGVVALTIAIVLGLIWSLQVSRPVERLADFSQRIAQGEWDEPLKLKGVRELETLASALDRMRADLGTYRAKLVASERQAAWSQMARKVAHEIRNPLTPIAVSVADLKRSYDQKRPDFPEILDQAVRTIGEEVESLKRLLQEFSDFGRFPRPQLAELRLADLFSDLETLYRRDVTEGRLRFSGSEPGLRLRGDRAQLRQALVNLVQNGLEAVAGKGRVEVEARSGGTTLEIAVSDDGPGLSPEQRAQLFVPDFTTKAHGSGLGLTIVERIVGDHDGTIAVDSVEGRTTFRIRMPVGREADGCRPS